MDSKQYVRTHPERLLGTWYVPTTINTVFTLFVGSILNFRDKISVVVVVVDSHIQRIVLATEETTVTQQVSHRPIKCQSRLWSQRGTKVNGSHHGDNPLLRPKGSKSRQKVMRLYKQWHRPISKRFIKPPYSISRATSIDSECCRLPTTNVLSKQDKCTV